MSITAQPNLEVEEAEDTGVRPYPWTVKQYYRAYRAGVFQPGERLELLDGVIYQKGEASRNGKAVTAHYPPHFTSIRAVTKAMERAFGPGFEVRSQGPIAAGPQSDPEPDVAVVDGSFRDYENSQPTPAEVRLVVEVSVATLRYDRGIKARLYARLGIREYWILNVRARTLEVRRDPAPLQDDPSAFDYESVTRYAEGESVSPLAAPESIIRVADLLPTAKTES